MKVFVFSDTHRDYKRLREIVEMEAELFVCAGDLSNFGSGLEESGQILAPLGARLLVIPGNNETHADLLKLSKRHGFVDFHGQTHRVGKHILGGLGYSPPTPFGTPGEMEDSEFAKRLEAFTGLQNLLLITHGPPHGTELDRVWGGRHVGSKAIREFILRERPLLNLSGHIHETEGVVTQLGATECENVGKRGRLLEL